MLLHIFFLNLLFLSTLYFWGVGESNRGWLRFGSIGIQPGEAGKLVFILTFAAHLSAAKKKGMGFLQVLGLIAHAGVCMGFVMFFSRDDGMTLSYAAIALAAALVGRNGACGTGRILFFVTLPLLIVMPFFAGEPFPAAEYFHLPVPLISGACAAHGARRSFSCAVISCGIGAGIGAALRLCGGVCCELYMYASLFFCLLIAADGIISCASHIE